MSSNRAAGSDRRNEKWARAYLRDLLPRIEVELQLHPGWPQSLSYTRLDCLVARRKPMLLPKKGESVAGLLLNKISLNATLWFSTKAIGEAQKQTSSSTRKFSLNARTHIFNRRRFSSKPVRYQKTQLQSAVGADRTPAVRLSYSGLRSRIQEKSRVHSKSGKTLFAKQKRHLSPTNSFCGPDKTSDLQLSFRPRLWVFRPAPILQADSSFLRR